MCKACKTYEQLSFPLTPEATREALDLVATDPSHFDALLDKLLGTEMVDSDPDLDAAWQAAHRRERP